MEYKQLAVGILIILLVAGVSGVSASAPVAGSIPSRGAVEYAQAIPGWQQVNSNGFGDLDAGEVSALAPFNSYLYAGTFNPIDPPPGPIYDGARIFRSSDGVTWHAVTDPGFGITHDIAPPAILDLFVFKGYLYASTGRGDGPAQIWRTVNGTTWTPMVIHGFSNPDTVDITALYEFNGLIYAGAKNLINGAQIWRSYTGDNNTWTKVAPDALQPAATRVTGMAMFDTVLYAAVESAGSAQVWRSSGGGDWTTVMSNGFGNSLTKSTGGIAEFAGYLYVGAGNEANGAQLWRTNDGTSWAPAITPGFGDPNNQKVEMVFVFENQLYVSVKNVQTGLELWRSPDGLYWERANQDGFGDSHNSGSNWSNAITGFLGQLYVGTVNALDGGELWRMQGQTPTPTPSPPPTVSIPVYVPLILH